MSDKKEKRIERLIDVRDNSKFVMFIEFAFELFKIIMSCGLCALVPQRCYGFNKCQNDETHYERVCLVMTNITFECLTTFNKFAILCNVFTGVCFICLYCVEVSRDRWIMKHFDKKSNVSIPLCELAITQRDLFGKLNYYNSIYYFSYRAIVYVFFSNTLISAIICFYKFYDLTTVTVFFSNILLCSLKIADGLYISYISINKAIPLCYHSKSFVPYNSIIDVRKNSKKVFIDNDIEQDNKIVQTSPNIIVRRFSISSERDFQSNNVNNDPLIYHMNRRFSNREQDIETKIEYLPLSKVLFGRVDIVSEKITPPMFSNDKRFNSCARFQIEKDSEISMISLDSSRSIRGKIMKRTNSKVSLEAV
jgi:hypothetical protein